MKAEEATARLNEEQIRRLLEIAGLTTTADDLTGPLNKALELAIESVGGTAGSVMMTNHDGSLRFAAAIGLDKNTVAEINSKGIKPGEGIAGKVLAEKQPLLLNQDNGISEEIKALMTRVNIASAICVPLIGGRKVIGVLNINRTEEGQPFSNADLEMLVAVAAELYPVITRRRNMEAIYEAIVALVSAKAPAEMIFPMLVLARALMLNEISLFIIETEDEGERYLTEVISTVSSESRHKVKVEKVENPSALLSAVGGKKTLVYQADQIAAINPDDSKEARSFAVIPLVDQGQHTVGAMVIYEEPGCQVTLEEVVIAKLFSRTVALQILHLRDIKEQIDAQQRMIFVLAAALEARSHYTSGHSNRVSIYAGAVGKKLGLSPEELQLLIEGALVHDIGKVGIPDSVLEKPDKLTDDEWTLMKQHPQLGVAIIKDGGTFSTGVARYILCHHERPDGKGYPNGIKDLTIPELILGAVDAFDAMTSVRNYRQQSRDGMPIQDAVLEMIRCSGGQFNIDVVKAFIAALKEGVTVTTDGANVKMELSQEICREIGQTLLHRATPDADWRNREQIPSHLATQFATLFPLN
ncbi:MAG: HD domain-containing phosphohydrolase [Candidatus Buchananbacteria bacterium]